MRAASAVSTPPRGRRLLPVVIAAVGALMASACGDPKPAGDPSAPSSPSTTAEASRPPRPAPEPAPAPAAATSSLDFEGAAVFGAPVDARSLAGTDVALWFWAPW